jgi:uncharacterized protein YheU (UPF0270 family)
MDNKPQVMINTLKQAGLVQMSIHRIPVNRLSPEALQGVIEEFVSRDGTDYGEIEVSRETKFRHVKYKLETGLAILIFDDETETTNIFLANDPILKRLDALTG